MRAWPRAAVLSVVLAVLVCIRTAEAQQGGGPGGRSGGSSAGPSGPGAGGGPNGPAGPGASPGSSPSPVGGLTAPPAVAALPGPGTAPIPSSSPDADAVRDAVASGRSVPFARVLAAVAAAVDGTVVGVDVLDAATGRLSYAVKVLTPDGDLRVVLVNARRGVVETVR